MLAAIGCGPAPDPTHDPSLAPAAVVTRRLTTESAAASPTTRSWLIDEHGRKVLLRGVNGGGRAKMAPFVPFDFAPSGFDAAKDAYFAHIAALGANAVRLTLSWEGLEPKEGQRDLDYWTRYRDMIDAAHRHGLGVIVDLHQDVYASPFCGDGFPLWTLAAGHGLPRYDCSYLDWSLPYFDPASAVNQAFERFWTDADGIRTKFAQMWKFVATELAQHPGVLGFEILNEPGAGSSDPLEFQKTRLPAFYEQLGAVIEAAAGPAVIFGGTNAGDASASHTLVAPRLAHFAFAPHYYDALAFLNIETIDPDRLRAGLLTTIALPGSPQVPIIIGEYGMPNSNLAKEGYLDAMLALFDEYQLSAVHWDAHVSAQLWNHEDFTVFAPDGSERSWARALDRPYPRAVAGADATFSYDLASSTFKLAVSGATAQVTEVYIPSRRFGAAPQVTLTSATPGARWNWLAEQQLLLLAASPGASYTVSVTPQ